MYYCISFLWRKKALFIMEVLITFDDCIYGLPIIKYAFSKLVLYRPLSLTHSIQLLVLRENYYHYFQQSFCESLVCYFKCSKNKRLAAVYCVCQLLAVINTKTMLNHTKDVKNGIS